MGGAVDLHSHTTASDGALSPAALVALAASRGVAVLAITDHDTVGGLDEASAAGRSAGVHIVPGIELAATLNRREIHILGHFVEPHAAALGAHLEGLKERRRDRMAVMVARLNQDRVPVTLEEVERIAGAAPLTRPHLARALVERRLASSIKEAFHRFLKDGLSAVLPHQLDAPERAIEKIHLAGGVATLAHPMTSGVNERELIELAGHGLDAVELDHPDQPPSYRDHWARLARGLDLVITAGSDFHGEALTPRRPVGCVSMSPADLARLERRRGS